MSPTTAPVGVLRLFLLLCAIAGGVEAEAQTITATVRGKVVDQQSAVLPGVTITVRHVETNTTRTVVTNEVGQYYLPGLQAGTYEVTASLQEFAPGQRRLELTVGSDVTSDFALKLSAVAEQLTVTGEAPLIETTRTVVGQTITKEKMDALPTVNRDFLGLAQLAPGVSSGVGGNGPTLAVNAQRGYQNNIFVDGASNIWQYYGRQASTFSQDWIQEFEVMTNSFAAEFGNASGGVINVITRSGSNTYQGRLYGYIRRKAFDSPPFAGEFENGEPVFLDKADVPDYTQRRWGGFLGGPIVRDRLFFFTGYEDLDRESTDTLGISDFWKAQGYDPVVEVKNTDHPFIIKGDYSVNPNNRISIRYDRTIAKAFNSSWYGSIVPLEGRVTEGGPVWNVVGNWTSTLSNTSFNEFRGYFMSNRPPVTCNLSGLAGMANFANARPGTYSHQRYPTLRTGCTIFHGLEGEENLGFGDNFSFITGRHQVKFGGQLIQNRMIVDIANFHDGYWRFAQDKVFDRSDPSTYPYIFIGNVGPGGWKSPIWNYNFYAQDTWRIRDDLTLNLGLRYDVDRSVAAGNEFIDAKNASIVAKFGGEPYLVKTNVDYDNISPRVGFVWTPDEDKKTTVRGAFGFFYDQNHGNFNAIYIINTLLGDTIDMNCNSPVSNPFWNPADTAASRTACRGFFARDWPYFPDVSLAPTLTPTMDTLDQNLQVPRTMQYTGGVAHEFPGGLMLGADFVHSRGSGLMYIEQNVRLVSPTEAAIIDPRFSNVTELQNVGFVHYTGLQTQAQYRRRDLNFGLSYTLSKADSNLGSGSIFGSTPTNPLDLSEDEGPDATDQRHNLAFNGSYTFPYDVQLAGIVQMRSGRPWSAYTNENPQDFVYPPRIEQKGARRGDSYKTVDLRVGKSIRFAQRARATIFWEMFNTFNWRNFQEYDGELESSSFGFPLGAADMRRQQFGFRVDF